MYELHVTIITSVVGMEVDTFFAVARSVACLRSGTFFREKQNPSSADSRRASCQLLAEEWALNTGKLSPTGLPRNCVAK